MGLNEEGEIGRNRGEGGWWRERGEGEGREEKREGEWEGGRGGGRERGRVGEMLNKYMYMYKVQKSKRIDYTHYN